MKTLADVVGNYEVFLQRLLKELVDDGFELNDFVQIDHMCYRTASLEDYAAIKLEMSQVADLKGENTVNGRPISVYRLREPVTVDRWRVDAVEVPAPKYGSEHPNGLEHVELVLYDDFDRFLKKYSGKQFEMRAADRGINPEIGYQLPSFGVKFHLLNILTVVYLENKLGMIESHDGM